MKDNLKRNIIWNTIGVFTFSLTSLIYTVILMRYSSLQITGIFFFFFSLACTTTALASLGGRTYQVTDVKNELTPFTYILSRYITAFTVTILVFVYIMFRNYTMNKFLIVFILCLFKYLEELSDVYYGIMQKEDKLYYVGQFQLFKSILNVFSFFLIIKETNNLLLAVSVMWLINFLFIIFLERPTAKKLNCWNYSTSKKQIMKYFSVNTTICVFTFLTMYLANAPRYAIDIYLSDEIQAVFGIIIMPATVMLLVCNFITNPILIKIANLYSEKRIKEITQLFKKIIFIIVAIGIFGLIVCYFIGVPFLNLIYSSNFNNYKLELIIIIVGSIFYAVSMICSSFLTSIRKIKPQLYMNILFSIFAFIISLIFVKLFGIMGGAISYSTIMFIRMMVYLIYTIKKLENKE